MRHLRKLTTTNMSIWVEEKICKIQINLMRGCVGGVCKNSKDKMSRLRKFTATKVTKVWGAPREIYKNRIDYYEGSGEILQRWRILYQQIKVEGEEGKCKNRSTKSETREVGPQWACQLWKEWRTSWAWDHLLPSNVRAIVIHNVAKCKEHKAELQRQGLGNWATCCQWSLKWD